MTPYLYYLVGPPASGKRTVGLHLTRITHAVLLDNHLANDPVLAAVGLDCNGQVPDEVWELAYRVRAVLREATLLAPPELSHIFTNYLSKFEREWSNVQRLRDLAARRGAHFVPVWLTCPLQTLEQRVSLPSRHTERLKMTDGARLRQLMNEAGNLPPPPDALVLDTSRCFPDEAAREILAFAKERSV